MNDIEEIVSAIRRLPTLTIGNLTKLIYATEHYAHSCDIYGDTSEVRNYLLDALKSAESVRVYSGEESAA